MGTARPHAEERSMKKRGRSALIVVGVLLAWSLAFIAPYRAFADGGQADADINLTLSAQVEARDAASSAQYEPTAASGSLQVATGDGLASVVVPFAFAFLFASAALVLLIPPMHTRVGKEGEV